MTEEELAAIEAGAKAVPPGPWTYKAWRSDEGDVALYPVTIPVVRSAEGAIVCRMVETGFSCRQDDLNGTFIARAHAHVTALASEVRTLRAELAQLQGIFGDLIQDTDRLRMAYEQGKREGEARQTVA